MPDLNIRSVENLRSSQFLSVYANNVEVAVNFFDVSMTFGQMVGPSEDGQKLMVDQSVRVTMSPTQTKILIAALLEQMVQYEKRFGDVVMPAEVQLPPIGGALLRSFELASRQAKIRHAAAKDDADSTGEDEDDKGNAGKSEADSPA
jgi:hypothetical protein